MSRFHDPMAMFSLTNKVSAGYTFVCCFSRMYSEGPKSIKEISCQLSNEFTQEFRIAIIPCSVGCWEKIETRLFPFRKVS